MRLYLLNTNRCCHPLASYPPCLLLPPRNSRTKTEFIGFAGRRARTMPAPGLYFPLFPSQSSRSKTEFIGFAGRRARTGPAPGLYFPLFPAQSSRSKTEFIGFADRRARTSPAPGLYFPFSRLKVRAQKPNSLALRAGEREPCAPCRSPGLRQIPCTKNRVE